jgi:hypothetical protein
LCGMCSDRIFTATGYEKAKRCIRAQLYVQRHQPGHALCEASQQRIGAPFIQTRRL